MNILFQGSCLGDDDNNCTMTSTCVIVDGYPQCYGVDVLCVGVCGDGILAQQEQCDHGSSNGKVGDCCSSSCTFASPAIVCRAITDVCDVAEYCTGSSAQCPPNFFATNATLCHPPSAVCDIPEYCTGFNASCPTDVWFPAGTPCNPNNNCTPIANCTNLGKHVMPRDVVGACTGPDVYCTGVCGDGIVATQEICDLGVNNGVAGYCCTKQCTFSTSVCRPTNGSCDVAEQCSGSKAKNYDVELMVV